MASLDLDQSDSSLHSVEDDASYHIAFYEKYRDSPELIHQLYQFLRSSCEQGKFDCMTTVLKEFPEFRASKEFYRIQFTPFLMAAAKAGNLGFIRFLFEEWSTYCEFEPERDNLLVVACLSEHFEMVKYLHEMWGITSTQERLLLFCIKRNQLDMARYLHEVIGLGPGLQKEKAIMCAFKSHSLEMIEYCFYDLDLSTVTYMKTIESAIYAAATSGNIGILQALTDLFSVTVAIPSIPPNRYMQKKHHLYHSIHIIVSRGDLPMLQYCIEVLKVTITSPDVNSDMTQYLDLLSLCVNNGDEDMLSYLVKEVKMSIDVLYQITNTRLSRMVQKDWEDEESKERVLEWVEELERARERSEEEDDEPVKRQRTNSM